jgi:hypothetical protein
MVHSPCEEDILGLFAGGGMKREGGRGETKRARQSAILAVGAKCGRTGQKFPKAKILWFNTLRDE